MPKYPFGRELEESTEQGRIFYLILLRYFLGSLPIATIYWILGIIYVNDPPDVVRFSYSGKQHEKNQTYLVELVSEYDEMPFIDEEWSLTDNLNHYRRCAYQVLFSRRVGENQLTGWNSVDSDVSLEPEYP